MISGVVNEWGVPVVTITGTAPVVVERVEEDSGRAVVLGRFPAGVFRDLSAPAGFVSYRAGGVSTPRLYASGAGVYSRDGFRVKMFNRDNNDPVEYQTGVESTDLASGGCAYRLPLQAPAHRVVVDLWLQPSQLREVRRLVDSGLVWVRLGRHVEGVPSVRLVAVEDVDTERFQWDLHAVLHGRVVWDSESDTAPPIDVLRSAGGVTYRECRNLGLTWGSVGSYLNAAEKINGGHL